MPDLAAFSKKALSLCASFELALPLAFAAPVVSGIDTVAEEVSRAPDVLAPLVDVPLADPAVALPDEPDEDPLEPD